MKRGGALKVGLIATAAFAVVMTSAVLAVAAALDYPAEALKGAESAAPLEALTSFAALSVAIAISYAGLPNFRHRLRVEEYVQQTVKASGLLDVLGNAAGNPHHLCNHDRWAVLYRLGNLREMKNASAPGTDGKKPIDGDFLNTIGFRSYSWIYASNLDKVLATCLGALAGTAIWFAALDSAGFHDPVVSSPQRMGFFSDVDLFYWIAAILCALMIFSHKKFWGWILRSTPSTDHRIHQVGWLIAAVFLLTMAMASAGWSRYHSVAEWLCPGDEHVLFCMTETMLLTVTFVPLALIWGGEKLTAMMITKADNCVEFLKAQLGERASNANIEGEAAPR